MKQVVVMVAILLWWTASNMWQARHTVDGSSTTACCHNTGPCHWPCGLWTGPHNSGQTIASAGWVTEPHVNVHKWWMLLLCRVTSTHTMVVVFTQRHTTSQRHQMTSHHTTAPSDDITPHHMMAHHFTMPENDAITVHDRGSYHTSP